VSNERILRAILLSEGGMTFTDDPVDMGGPSLAGLTLDSYSDHVGRPVTVEELRSLTEAEVLAVYESRYIVRPRFAEITDELLRWQVVDAGVLSGPARASQWLQRALGLKVDGKLGPETLAAANAQPAHRTALRLAAIRCAFFGGIVAGNPSQVRFLRGWMARALAFVEREANR
jgi:lysozyme family protein